MKKGKSRNSGLLPNSLRIISSCLKTVSTNASTVASTVRSAGASVAASISVSSEDRKDQVIWAGFDKLELGPSAFKHVLLVGYQNGFQVLDVEDASNFSELVSKRDGPITFLQLQPFPATSDGKEQGFRSSHPLLLVVACDETNGVDSGVNHCPTGRLSRDDGFEAQSGNFVNAPTEVRFYSIKSHSYVHALRFRSAVYMVRCSPRFVAVGLAAQIYCFDALTLENKFSVLTYPVPQLGGQGASGVNVNIGYGPLAVGPRWLAYASNNPLTSNSGRISSKNLSPSPGVSPSTSPGNGSLVARYAMESSKQLAAGIMTLGDKGYKSLSRYYQEMLPDGSSTLGSPCSEWSGRPAATETDNAGMVVVKDFVSRAVIAQFIAHSSPISALCFDPSGTLLVTASIYGNNINIFRIIPSCSQTGSGSESYDWSNSHVHLYKLHRGITSAIIRDICFSDYSQWVAIISSKGTCHIYLISPFGGDTGLQTLDSQSEERFLSPVLSSPWWSTSAFTINQQSCSSPAPVSLSVVSRIRDSYTGWIGTVTNAAASATGKVSLPSGAVAAVFYNSITQNHQHHDVSPKVKSLEHLLVYTPSGHVVQHELLPTIAGSDGNENNAMIIRPGSLLQTQDEDLRVKVDPIQWWDVCRRSDWPEKEVCNFGTTFDKLEASGSHLGKSDCDYNYRLASLEMSNNVVGKVKTDSINPHERAHCYLSNAEVQINCGRLPIWQNSKICFSTIGPEISESYTTGEFEIEKMIANEVESRRKDLLPVFDNFHGFRSRWNDSRGLAVVKDLNDASVLELHQAKDKFSEEVIMNHSNPASLSSTESSDGGSSRRIDNLLDIDQINSSDEHSLEKRERVPSTAAHSTVSQKSIITVPSSNNVDNDDNHIENFIIKGLNNESDYLNSPFNIYEKGQAAPMVLNSVKFDQCLQEGNCKALDHEECCVSGIANDDVDPNNKRGSEKLEDEENNNDDVFCGVFAFSEEGKAYSPMVMMNSVKSGQCKAPELEECFISDTTNDGVEVDGNNKLGSEKLEDEEDNDDMFAFFEEGKTSTPMVINSVKTGQCLQEGSCKTSDLEECCISDIANDADSNNKLRIEKLEHEEDHDDMFVFSEESKASTPMVMNSGQCLQEGNAPNLGERCISGIAINHVDSNNMHTSEKLEYGEDHDDMLGGMFVLSEEGNTSTPMVMNSEEGHRQTSDREECCISGISNDDVDSNNKREPKKLEEKEDHDDMFGGMFAFSEED